MTLPSLENLCPTHWSEGRILSHSIILRYGAVNGPKDSLSSYLREHCVSAIQLRHLALNAYSKLSREYDGLSDSVPAYLFLTSSVSCLDAIGCVLLAGVTGQIKPEGSEPSIAPRHFSQERALLTEVVRLTNQDWCKALSESRNRIIHRGYWPSIRNLFRWEGDCGWYSDPARQTDDVAGIISAQIPLDIPMMVKGFIEEVETWDLSLAALLDGEQKVSPVNYAMELSNVTGWHFAGHLGHASGTCTSGLSKIQFDAL